MSQFSGFVDKLTSLEGTLNYYNYLPSSLEFSNPQGVNSASFFINEEEEPEEERKTANLRERKRMCGINELRNQIPTFPYEKRLSKIDTLNLAIAYIKMLEEILETDEDSYEFLQKCVNNARHGVRNTTTVWDLLARLNWINWKNLGIPSII